MGRYMLSFSRYSSCQSEYIKLPQAICVSSDCSTLSSKLVLFIFLKKNLAIWWICNGICHCGFNLHFPKDCCDFEHIYIFSLSIWISQYVKCLLKSFIFSENWVVCILLNDFQELFIYSEYNSYVGCIYVIYLSHSVNFLLIYHSFLILRFYSWIYFLSQTTSFIQSGTENSGYCKSCLFLVMCKSLYSYFFNYLIWFTVLESFSPCILASSFCFDVRSLLFSKLLPQPYLHIHLLKLYYNRMCWEITFLSFLRYAILLKSETQYHLSIPEFSHIISEHCLTSAWHRSLNFNVCLLKHISTSFNISFIFSLVFI